MPLRNRNMLQNFCTVLAFTVTLPLCQPRCVMTSTISRNDKPRST